MEAWITKVMCRMGMHKWKPLDYLRERRECVSCGTKQKRGYFTDDAYAALTANMQGFNGGVE